MNQRGLFLVLSFFFAGPGIPGAMDQAVIRLWDYHVHDKKFRKDIFREFNSRNPEIKVEYTSQVSETYVTILDAAFRTGTPPDIFVPTGAASLSKLIDLGWVIPLDEVAPGVDELRKWMALFPQDQLPFVDNTNVINGKVYSWPIRSEGGYMMLFWNNELFRQAGLSGPRTWEDLRSAAKKITEMGQGKNFGIVHGIKNPVIWAQDVLYSLATAEGWSNWSYWGGHDFRTGRFDFHHPALRGAMQFWLDMKKDGSIFPGDLSMDDEQAKYKFSQGLAGMIFGGPWVPGGILAITDSLDFDVELPPTKDGGPRKGGVGVGALADTYEYVISSKVKSRVAAWKVVQFMTSREYQEGWVKAGGGFSVFPQYNKTEFFPHPTSAKIVQMGQEGRRVMPPRSAGALKVMELWNPGQPGIYEVMQGLWVGQLGWEAWDDLEQRWNKAMDDAIAEAQAQDIKVSKADFTFPDWDPAQNYPPPKRTGR